MDVGVVVSGVAVFALVVFVAYRMSRPKKKGGSGVGGGGGGDGPGNQVEK